MITIGFSALWWRMELLFFLQHAGGQTGAHVVVQTGGHGGGGAGCGQQYDGHVG